MFCLSCCTQLQRSDPRAGGRNRQHRRSQQLESIPDAVRVTLLDRNDAFFFGFSKLEVMLGCQSAEEVKLPYRDIAKPGVEFRQEAVTGIDAGARRVTTDAGTYDADFVVVALGADYDMAAAPGFEAGGHNYYTLAGAERLRDELADFDGGKVLVSVLGQPFKCPPAPFEGSFLLHEYFTQRGIRDSVQMSTTFPMQRPVPVTAAVSQMFRDGLAERGIEELPQHLVTGIDPTTRTAQLASGEALSYDLFVGIPLHRAPDVLGASGLTVNGWVPVDQDNLRTQFPGVYALGDVCTGPRTVPKAGIFAESRSTSLRARHPTPSDTIRHASTPSRNKSSARSGEPDGSVVDANRRPDASLPSRWRCRATSAAPRHVAPHPRLSCDAHLAWRAAPSNAQRAGCFWESCTRPRMGSARARRCSDGPAGHSRGWATGVRAAAVGVERRCQTPAARPLDLRPL
jgi:sulfide:quinone oxidoreductase